MVTADEAAKPVPLKVIWSPTYPDPMLSNTAGVT
jgi:hypothetical protein